MGLGSFPGISRNECIGSANPTKSSGYGLSVYIVPCAYMRGLLMIDNVVRSRGTCLKLYPRLWSPVIMHHLSDRLLDSVEL